MRRGMWASPRCGGRGLGLRFQGLGFRGGAAGEGGVVGRGRAAALGRPPAALAPANAGRRAVRHRCASPMAPSCACSQLPCPSTAGRAAPARRTRPRLPVTPACARARRGGPARHPRSPTPARRLDRGRVGGGARGPSGAAGQTKRAAAARRRCAFMGCQPDMHFTRGRGTDPKAQRPGAPEGSPVTRTAQTCEAAARQA